MLLPAPYLYIMSGIESDSDSQRTLRLQPADSGHSDDVPQTPTGDSDDDVPQTPTSPKSPASDPNFHYALDGDITEPEDCNHAKASDDQSVSVPGQSPDAGQAENTDEGDKGHKHEVEHDKKQPDDDHGQMNDDDGKVVDKSDLHESPMRTETAHEAVNDDTLARENHNKKRKVFCQGPSAVKWRNTGN